MKFLIVLLFIPFSVFAERYIEYHEDPNALFSTEHNVTNMSNITWEQTDDVQGRCNAENRIRGIKEFGFSVEACAFWGKRLGFNVCHIITSKKTSLATIGHEIRHCFQGDFHENYR